jgi:diguanylate cyclase (GGDEF)-like protein
MGLLGIFTTLLILEYNVSFEKITNLKNQKHIISTLTNLKKDDIELAIIQFNGKSTQLLNEINKLRNSYKLDFTGNYLFNTSTEYLNDLNKLSALTRDFNKAAKQYYTDELKKHKKDEKLRKKELDNAFVDINTYIDSIMLKDLKYKEAKFHLLEKVSISLAFLILFVMLWYIKRLNQIHKDILFLYAVDRNKKNYKIFSEEADAISMRMKRKPAASDNPTMLDPITNINNLKGLIFSYGEKKNLKKTNFMGVAIFEIDNFSKTNRAFTQEFTQAVLKKIAFTISLHEQATDIIARTDYNQFTIIFSRTSKEQLYKDIDIIRQSISEIKFASPNRKTIQITVSGGFVIKTSNTSLDDSFKKAKEILRFAQSTGGNKVSQIKDLAEHEL